MVRHRLCSFAQESTRYCNYSGDKFGNEITVIRPYWLDEKPELEEQWEDACSLMEDAYLWFINEKDLQPQAARGILPNDLKTEINVKANLREWRAIFKLRTASSAHPDMRRVMIPLLEELRGKVPVIFDDITLIV